MMLRKVKTKQKEKKRKGKKKEKKHTGRKKENLVKRCCTLQLTPV